MGRGNFIGGGKWWPIVKYRKCHKCVALPALSAALFLTLNRALSVTVTVMDMASMAGAVSVHAEITYVAW